MKLVTPSFYKDFECIAGDCPDSCCQGWEVDADNESMKYYKTMPDSAIKERIFSVLDKDEFGNTIFHLADKKRCPFLNNENLCDMHIAIGGEHTPYTCRTFPRYINDFGATREMGIAYSCPVAADMMWDENTTFDFSAEQNALPPVINDIDAELYFLLLTKRKVAYSIAKDRSISIAERIIKLLDFASELQKEIDDYKEGTDGVSLAEVFKNPEVINNEWVEKVNNPNKNIVIENSVQSENIIMYFLFRYFLTAVFDRDVLSKVKMTAMGVLVPALFGYNAWTIHLWSKETEHSDVNMERYKNELRNNGTLSVQNLKKYFIF